jgi:hypothetical protein
MAGNVLVRAILRQKPLRNGVVVLHCSKNNFICIILNITLRSTRYAYSLHNKEKKSPLCYMPTLEAVV